MFSNKHILRVNTITEKYSLQEGENAGRKAREVAQTLTA